MSKKTKENVEMEVEDQTADATATDIDVEIKAAFDEAIDSESDEDEIKMAMIGAGATFKNVTRLFNQFMIDSGLAISKEERSQIVEDTLAGRSFESEEDFDGAVSALLDTVTGSTDRSAASLIRAYAKKNELEVYKKPKAESTGQRNAFVHRYYDALVANPAMTELEAHNFIHGKEGNPETTQNVKNYEKMHQNVRIVANKINEKING